MTMIAQQRWPTCPKHPGQPVIDAGSGDSLPFCQRCLDHLRWTAAMQATDVPNPFVLYVLDAGETLRIDSTGTVAEALDCLKMLRSMFPLAWIEYRGQVIAKSVGGGPITLPTE